jgi:hypothetical protein
MTELEFMIYGFLDHLVKQSLSYISKWNNDTKSPAWEEHPFCDYGGWAKLSIYKGPMLFYYPMMWPDFEVLSFYYFTLR